MFRKVVDKEAKYCMWNKSTCYLADSAVAQRVKVVQGDIESEWLNQDLNSGVQVYLI